MRTPVKIGIGFGLLAALAIGYVVYSTLALAAYTGEVCVEYKGRRNCGTASGSTREEAIATAQDLACATISSGVSESIGCSNVEPVSVTWIEP